jgi:hypothetical protein
MKCSDISSRLVDFLYEELSTAERAEFSAHLAGCPTCATEVKASSRALQRSRTALRGPLNEDPPARVHANILAMARAAAQPARKPPVEEKSGFFARLLKTPWLIPAMGAAGVATAVFLIKVIKNPEVLPVREQSIPEIVAKPQPAENQAPAPVAAPAEPQAEAKPAAPTKEEHSALAGKRDHVRPLAATARSAPPAPPMRAKKQLMDDPLAGIDMGDAPAARSYAEAVPLERAAPAPTRAAPAAKAATNAGAWAEPPPPRGMGGTKDHKAEVDDLREEGASGAGARQPMGQLRRATPQRSAEAAGPMPSAPAASAIPLPPAPSAPKPAAPPRETFTKKKSADMMDMSEEVARSAPQPSVAAEKEADRAEKKGSRDKETFDDRVRKAARLYEEKNWAEAAAAYRALLDEAPKHASAPVWRQRMAIAENAEAEKNAIKAKKKVSDDALDGIKL